MISASVQGDVSQLTLTRLRMAYQRVRLSTVSSLLVSSLAVTALWPVVAPQGLLVWLLALWSILGVRYLFARRFLNLDPSVCAEPNKWITGYVIGAAATGLCWGITVFCFPESPRDQATLLLVFVIAGVSAFASATMASIPQASNAFMLSSLLPVALWLFLFDQHIMAVIALVYLGLMLLLSRQIHDALLSYVVSNHQNKELTSVDREREERYRAQSNLLHSVMESPSDVSVWALDRDFRYLMFNAEHRKRSKKMRGMDIAIGMSAIDLVAREDFWEFFRRGFGPVLADHSLSVETRENVVQDGSTRYEYYEHHGSPICNDAGEVVGLTVFSHNITERKRMEHALEDSHNFLSKVINSISDPISVKDSEHRWILLNDTCCAMIGHPRETLLGKSDYDFFPKEQADVFWEKDDLVYQSGQINLNEEALTGADGNTRHLLTQKSPFTFSDGQRYIVATSRDITERKAIEKALGDSEHMLQEAQRIAHVGSWDVDMVNDKLVWSDEIFRIWEIDKTKFKADFAAFLETVHPQDRERVGRIYSESILNHSLYEVEHRLLFPDGRVKYVLEQGEPQYDAQGKPVRFIGTSLDITERKRLQNELVGREREFRSLAENLPDNIARWDTQGRYVYFNPAIERTLGAPGSEVYGKRPNEAFPDGRFNAIETVIDQMLATDGETQTVRLTAPHPEGGLYTHDVSLVPEFDAEGRILGVLGLGHDITDILRLQEAIAARERELRALAESSPGMMGALYSRPDGSMCMPYVSPKIEELFGLRPQDVVNDATPILAMSHPDDARRVVDSIAESARNMTTWHEEYRIIHPTRGERWMESNTHPEPHSDGGIVWYGYVHDITERKQAERTLQENFDQINALNRSLEISARDMEEQAARLEASREQLQRTEAWYRGILQSAPDGMLVVNENGAITLVNEQLCRMFGYADDELIGLPIETLVPPHVHGDHVAHRNGFIRGPSKGKKMEGEAAKLKGRRKDGSEFFVDITLSRPPNIDASAGAICAAIRDVTEQQRLETALAEREHESRTLIDNTPDTIARFNRDGIRIFANQALANGIEGGLDAALGKTPTEVPGGEQSVIYEAKLHEVFATGVNTEFELIWPNKNGQTLCSHIRLTAEFDARGSVITVLAVGRDITELNNFRQKIHQMAFYDNLTSLPNRALFNDRLHHVLNDAQRHGQLVGVMLLDLDRFKAINDTLGHPAGDALLREAALRLTFCVRGYDTVARLGGDEFAILLPDIRSGDDLGRVASKILTAFNEPYFLEGTEVFVSTSIGIAVYPDDDTDPNGLIKQADSAMYFAKRSGRNNFRFYSKDLTASAAEKLSLESELRRALERKELELYYQPKVRLSDNRLVGSEALLRWNNPQRGLVPPHQFIAIAEDCGLITDIGQWVLRDACRTACEWNGAGKPLHKVAINLSARQFQSNDLVRTVHNILEETGCQPQWIELEITESLLLDEQDQVLEMLESFRVMGISIAIDDFGTGYSSLSYLARFPINTLKIDRSFIGTVTTEFFRGELVKAILSIARCLGQEVVAEGVETLEQAAFLQAHGCQIAQGYFYSKPVPKAAFEATFLEEFFRTPQTPR